MIISPNENGWSYDDSTGNWKLVYADKLIVVYEQTDVSMATGSTLFVGTKDECDAEIARLGLVLYPAESDDEVLGEGSLSDVEIEDSNQVAPDQGGGIISNTINFFKGLFGG